MKRVLLSLTSPFLITATLCGPAELNASNKPETFLKQQNSKTGFIENKGQIIDQNNKPNPAVLYLLNTPGFNVQLRASGWSYDVYSPTPFPSPSGEESEGRGEHKAGPSLLIQEKGLRDEVPLVTSYLFHRIDITLIGANPNCQIIPTDPLPDYFNYFTASAPPEGIKNVKQYKKITYKNIFPDIDLEFFTNDEHGYKYNFVIQPGASINDIRFKIAGPDDISFTHDTLKFGTRFGDVEELIPESYYIVNDSRVDLHAWFKKINNEVYGFSVDKPIPENSILIIDPTAIRIWGTYYGGSNNEISYECCVDKTGDVYLSGSTNSTNNIASMGSYQQIIAGNYDGFIVKFNNAGNRLWGTYYGGTNNENVWGCKIDKSGNIYISGQTKSNTGIATANAHQQSIAGGYDGFVSKFNPDGTRIWGTYYGGNKDEDECHIALDNNDNIYIAGITSSDTGIATPGTYQQFIYSTDSSDAFLAKFDSNGVRVWGTYFGGEESDGAESCSTDRSGNIYIVGITKSFHNIATPTAFQGYFGGGAWDGFIGKFSTTGQRLWSTYYGGVQNDEILGCVCDSNKNIIITGYTVSTSGIASPGCFQPDFGGGPYDGMVVKFDSSGQRLWGTYYGGINADGGYAISLGSGNVIFILGYTDSPNNISTPDSYQPNLYPNEDGFLTKFNTNGQQMWGTYYGGGFMTSLLGSYYVNDDTLYVTGKTTSQDSISTTGSWQTVFGGMEDAYLVKFLDCWQIDTAGPITGPVNICNPSTGVSYSIPQLAHAINYIWTLPSGFTISSGAGTQSVFVDISTSASSGTIWVKGVNKCGDFGDSASLYITVHQRPVPVITGPDNTCAGPGKVYLTAPGKTNYQWSVSPGGVITSGGTTSDNTVTVTWNVVGTQHVYVNYTDTSGCEALIPADFNVTVTPSPVVAVTINASSNNICEGTLITFTATPVNGGGNPSYQWQVNGINAGSNSSVYSYSPSNNDKVSCILTSSITGCVLNNPAISNQITMVVNPILLVSISISASENPFCQDSTVIFTATPTNGGTTPFYQWKVNGGIVGPNNPVYSYVPNNGDVVSCVLNSSIPCPTGNPVTSNSITMIENTNVSVIVSITPSANPVCAGTSVTYTAIPVNGGTTPVYQWKVNGIIVGSNSPNYSYSPINGDIVSCILTSSITACISNNPATSNAIVMVVNPNLPVSVTVTPSQNPVCAGTSVTFTANPFNGGTTPSYQWKVNGIGVGTNSPIYSYSPNNGDIVTCVLNSNAICITGNPATSNAITMIVNPNLPVSITISASANPFCQGSSVTFTATPTNGGAAPSYQWKVNGIGVGPNNQVYSYFPNNSDVVTCVLNSNIACPIGNPATSNAIMMIVNSNLPAGITIAASTNPFCPGSSVTFTATPTNGGSTPSYQWKVNGTNVGTNSNTYSYNPANNDSVRCVMTSNLACVTGNPASSAKIIMSGTLAPIVTFTSCFDTITTINAKPIKLKGGIPLSGTYSGPGVNSSTGIFTPSLAGLGTHTITYSYTNAALCTATKSISILILPSSILSCGNPLTDVRDNKVYQTIQIGTQCWLASNLNFGTTIASSQDQRDNCIAEKFCYNDNPINCTNQGGLYQWDELMLFDETPADQGFCPPGWHIPTENEWNTLFANYINSGFAASPLKYSGYSGFNALLSGARHINNGWDFQGFATFFWSSTLLGSTKAWAHGLNDIDPSVSAYPSSRVNAFSVRCLKD